MYIAAVAYPGACPADFGLTSARFRALGKPGHSGLNLRALMGGNHRGYEPLRLIVADDGAAGATLLDLQLPDTLITTPKCDPRDGWTSTRNRFRYTNYSNALPPACTPGSAEGLSRADFRWNGTNDVRVRVARGSLPQVVGPIRASLYRGTGPVNECDGYVGTANCLVSAGKAKCSPDY